MNLTQSAGDLTLHTGRAGAASRVGHDLTLRVGAWVMEAADGRVRLVAQLASLEVLRGDGGLKPLSDKDKETILENALKTLQATTHPEVVFEADVADGASSVLGTLSIAGVTKPLTLEVVRHPDRVEVRTELLQTDFGIKPYSGLMGALKVRDLVEVKADLTLPA